MVVQPYNSLGDMSKLFVRPVNKSCPRDVVRRAFERWGEVTDVDNTGKGYAFVTMIDQVN